MILLTIIYNLERLETLKLHKNLQDTLRFGLVSIHWSIANIQPQFMFEIFMVKFIIVLQANNNQFYQVWRSSDSILMNVTQNRYYQVHWFHHDVINQKEKMR